MKQGQRLNLKFSVKDVDFIVGLAKSGRTMQEIRDRMPEVSVPTWRYSRDTGSELVPVYLSEIQSICWQSGVKVRAAETV